MKTLPYDDYLSKHNLKVGRVLEHLALKNDDIVLLCGSVVEGFSNSGSDLDVYILSREELTLPLNYEVKNTYFGKEYHIFEEQIPINAIVMSLHIAQSIVEGLNSQLQEGNIDFNESRKIEFYHRLSTAVPIQGIESFQKFIQSKLNLKDFQLVVARNRLSYSENRHDDAVGALDSGDTLTAYTAARTSLEKAVESLLYLRGQTNPKEKWIIKKLYNVYSSETEWVQEFISLYLGQLNDLTENTINQDTIKMIRLANGVREMINDQV